MKEIRIHGRGGQGAVTASEIIVYAAVEGGKFAAGFPYFGFEKKGGAVSAFVRIDDRKIREKNQIYEPDCVLLIDPTIMTELDVFKGVKPAAIAVMNVPSLEGLSLPPNVKRAAYIDANKVSLDIFGKLLPNTVILGAFVKATGWVEFDKVAERTAEIWGPKNVEALTCGFDNVTIVDL